MSETAAAEIDAGTRVVSPRVALDEAGLGSYALAAAFTGDGAFWAIALGDGTVRWFEADAGLDAMETADLGALPLVLAPHGDGKGMVAGTDDGRLLALRPGGGIDTLASHPGTWIETLAAHASSGQIAYSAGRAVHVIGPGGGTRAVFNKHASTPAGLAFSPDGHALAVARYDGVTVWPLDGGGEPRDLHWHGSHTAVSWSPDGRFIVTAMQDKEMHCWRMADQKDMKMSGYPGKIRSLAWTADSAYIAASGAESVTAWCCMGDGPSGTAPVEFGYVYEGIVTQVAAHPRDRVIAGGFDDGTVFIGGTETEDAITARPGGGAAVTCLALSPGGGTLIAGSADGGVAVIRLLDAVV